MSEKTIRNAQVESTRLGPQDHGIFTATLQLDYGDRGQSFGAYSLDRYNPDTKEREGTAFGMEFIRRVMKVLEVENWEDVKGKLLRADCEYGKVHGIGHITKDKWFYPERDLERFAATS